MTKDTGLEVKSYKLKAKPVSSIPNAVLYVKSDTDTEVTTYITDLNGVPYLLRDNGGSGGTGVQTITNSDGAISVIGTENVIINLSTAIKNVINSSLQPGDNISELFNNAGYITIADIPSQVVDLQSISSPTNVVIDNSNGTNATILSATTTEAGVLLPGEKVKLNNLSGTNTGDQNSIVGISGTKTEYNTSLTDGDFLFVGDVVNYTDEQAQYAIGSILLGTATIDFTYDDVIPSILANVKSNSITSTELADNINITEFINNAGFEDTSQLNTRDINNRNRANHTGTQAISTVVNLQSSLDAKEDLANKTTDFTIVNNLLYPSVQATKNYVDSKIPQNYSKIVYVNSISPTTATIFDTNNPPTINDNSLKTDVNNLYIGTDASTWVYITTPAGYVTKAITAGTSNFYLSGTTIDAGSNKNSAVERTGTVGGAQGTAGNHFVTKAQLDLKESLSNKTSTVIGNESSSSLYLNILGAWTYFQQKLTDSIFGTFLFSLTSKVTPLDADGLGIFDTADSNKAKKLTFTNLKSFLKTYFDGFYLIPQITITTSVNITTATNDASGFGQKGRNVIIDNASSSINITVNGGTGFCASYVKHGSGTITFVQGSARTLTQVDGTAIFNGSVGSTATISSVGSIDYLRISNA